MRRLGATALCAEVLIVDADESVRQAIGRILGAAGYVVQLVDSGAQALVVCGQATPAVVMIGAGFTDMAPVQLCRAIKNCPHEDESFVIMLSNVSAPHEVETGFENGADGFVRMPVPDRELVARVGAMARISRAERALRASEMRYRQLFENTLEGVALHQLVCDDAGQPVEYLVIDANLRYGEITGLRVADVRGRTSCEVYGTSSPPFLETYSRVCVSGRAEVLEAFFEPMGKHFQISVFAVCEGQFATAFSDITERKYSEMEQERMIAELRATLKEVDTLHGLLPICMHCKQVRDDQGYWTHVETYIAEHSKVQFSHGLCPDCVRRMYPDLADEVLNKGDLQE